MRYAKEQDRNGLGAYEAQRREEAHSVGMMMGLDTQRGRQTLPTETRAKGSKEEGMLQCCHMDRGVGNRLDNSPGLWPQH